MTEQELRYWDRLGFYVTRADADDFINKAGNIGAVLDEDLEEFTPRSGVSQEMLKKEIDELFEKPFVSVALSSENNSILLALEFEKTRPARVKELKKEGHTTEEAKEIFKQELDNIVRESLGLPDETPQEKEYRERAIAIQEGNPDPAFVEEE
tara:strand:- start:1004 stop:1462 length:459 start_codon:yes stop_codon:yes gene_type:complete